MEQQTPVRSGDTTGCGGSADRHGHAAQARFARPSQAVAIQVEEGVHQRDARNDFAMFSARTYHRVLKLARTTADLAGEEQIGPTHLAEALQDRPKIGMMGSSFLSGRGKVVLALATCMIFNSSRIPLQLSTR